MKPPLMYSWRSVPFPEGTGHKLKAVFGQSLNQSIEFTIGEIRPRGRMWEWALAPFSLTTTIAGGALTLESAQAMLLRHAKRACKRGFYARP